VTIWLDDEAVVAERGEPAVTALVAAGRLALARSPKFHRPRGPTCLAGACEGCLARVNDVPNVMTCRVPAEEGLRIETQNVVGSRDTDLLRAADWFFPDGMNHHELMAGVPGIRRVVQGVARQVAGIGRLPALEPRMAEVPARRRDADVLVVGAGAAGMTAAMELAKRGRHVEVVDDDLAPGGSAGVLARVGEAAWRTLLAAFEEQVAKGTIRLRLRTTAAGIYGDDVLVGGAENGPLEVVMARTLVLATGCHDGALAFEGNDLPGIMSARAGCRLLGQGVAPGRKIVMVVAEGDAGPFSAAFARAHPEAMRVIGLPLRAGGRASVKSVLVATEDDGERELACDALLLEAPPAPAVGLAIEAGAEVTRARAGFFVTATPGGRVRDGVFALGEACGTALDPAAMTNSAIAMAELV